jgi:predicted nuclease of predicted toxin-antitoxin system
MRFLADESCDFRVVRALRADGHDVTSIIEISAGADDEVVLELAGRDDRIFVTEDRDFGQLVYSGAGRNAGVVLLRFPSNARERLPAAVVELIRVHGEQLHDRFVVLQPGLTRFGRRPAGP